MNFLYFVLVIGFSMLLMHPLCLVISFVCAFLSLAAIKGKNAAARTFFIMLPMLFFAAATNPLFSHKGITVIAYFPSGNPLTAEAVAYGFASAAVIGSITVWFQIFNAVMTSDKLICLFGKASPSLSLIFSMTLRFVPRFYAQAKKVAEAQRLMGCDVKSGNIISRAKSGLKILSAMITWALENAVDTADSMKARGYGLRGRTAYSLYRIGKSDAAALCFFSAAGLYITVGYFMGAAAASYYPSMTADASAYTVSVLFCYFLLCIYPAVNAAWEERKWNALRSKI